MRCAANAGGFTAPTPPWTTTTRLPAAPPAPQAYTQLDGYFSQLCAIEVQAAAMHDTEELFELPSTKLPELASMRSQLRTLKTLWDFRGLGECARALRVKRECTQHRAGRGLGVGCQLDGGSPPFHPLPPPHAVGATYDAWKSSLWASINTEELETANKKMATEVGVLLSRRGRGGGAPFARCGRSDC